MTENPSGGSATAHPYLTLPTHAFWRPAVAQTHYSQIGPLWTPKFQVEPRHRIATFGSCFAQHIGRALRERGFGWRDTEPAPPHLSDDQARAFNYGVFTCRTANIYTTTLLRQWTRWALGETPPDEVWEKDGRFFDPFRPAIEPNGFASREETLRLRAVTIDAFRQAIVASDLFVFTLGLTESWWNTEQRYEYPSCPGTIAGVFNSNRHGFRNLIFGEVIDGLIASIEAMRGANPDLRFLLTVSPVPLAATASGHHVLVATSESKAVLRAVAGQLARFRDYVDYFPSYEIITAAPMRGMFFEPNLRGVARVGVDFVMSQFFEGFERTFGPAVATPRAPVVRASVAQAGADVICEEELLDAFGDRD